MRLNNVITVMQAGEKAWGCRLTPAVAEQMGQAGLDHVSFDSEHGPFTPDAIDEPWRVADMAGLTPMARVPNIDPSTILRFLDLALWVHPADSLYTRYTRFGRTGEPSGGRMSVPSSVQLMNE